MLVQARFVIKKNMFTNAKSFLLSIVLYCTVYIERGVYSGPGVGAAQETGGRLQILDRRSADQQRSCEQRLPLARLQDRLPGGHTHHHRHRPLRPRWVKKSADTIPLKMCHGNLGMCPAVAVLFFLEKFPDTIPLKMSVNPWICPSCCPFITEKCPDTIPLKMCLGNPRMYDSRCLFI